MVLAYKRTLHALILGLRERRRPHSAGQHPGLTANRTRLDYE